MRKVTGLLALCFVLICAVTVAAQAADIEVKHMLVPEWEWGNQTFDIAVINHADYIKFLVVTTEVEFVDVDPPCRRESRFTAFLEPEVNLLIQPVVPVPGNYGRAELRVRFYDVVDTMDVIMPGQEFLDTTFVIEIDMPESARAWMERPIQLPPRVEQHLFFDNDFSRLLFQMLDEGYTREQISRMTGATMPFIQGTIHRLKGHEYIKYGEDNFDLTFPVISEAEAAEGRALALATAEKLAPVIKANLEGRPQLLDSLRQAGVIEGDSSNIFGGYAVLYRPYALVSGLLLWHQLGSQFITAGEPLLIYYMTDICNAGNTKFMYAAPAGPEYNGRHFYAFLPEEDRMKIIFADHQPEIECSGNYPIRSGVATKARWANVGDDRPEFLMIEPTVTQEVVSRMALGTDEIIRQAISEAHTLSWKYRQAEVSEGYKYWLWNLTATLTLDMLVEQGVISKDGNGHFMYAAVAGG